MVVAAGEDTQNQRLKAHRGNEEAKSTNQGAGNVKENETKTETVCYPSLWQRIVPSDKSQSKPMNGKEGTAPVRCHS